MKRLTLLAAVCVLLCAGCSPAATLTQETVPASAYTSASVPASAPAPSSSAVQTSAPVSSAPGSTAPRTSAPASSVPAASADPETEQTAEPEQLLDPEERAALDELIASYGPGVSVGWLDLLSGEEYLYEGDAVFEPASLVKAPFGLWLLTLCDSGELDPDEVLVPREEQIREGTGVIKDDPPGTSYTVRELIWLMLTVSDNTAFKMLRDRAGLRAYNRFCSDTLGVTRTTYLELTAADCLKILSAIADYVFPDGSFPVIVEEEPEENGAEETDEPGSESADEPAPTEELLPEDKRVSAGGDGERGLQADRGAGNGDPPQARLGVSRLSRHGCRPLGEPIRHSDPLGSLRGHAGGREDVRGDLRRLVQHVRLAEKR